MTATEQDMTGSWSITGQESRTRREPDALPAPNACGWCGIDKQEHANRWTSPHGWHQWEAPTDAQRLARMRARRIVGSQADALLGDPR